MTRTEAIRVARSDAFAHYDPDNIPLLSLHRELPGHQHEEGLTCWCSPLVMSLLDHRIEEFVGNFDLGQ